MSISAGSNELAAEAGEFIFSPMPEWLKMVLQGLIAVGGAYLSAIWAVHRAHQEKWWDRKEHTYSEIIDALLDITRYLEVQAHDYLQGGEYEHPKKKEIWASYDEAYWKVMKLTAVGAFVISEETAAVLKKLHERPRIKWSENAPWEVYEDEMRYFKGALSEIRDCALKDLKVGPQVHR
jgi:hypothetical protein